jgi:hypothetical protein
LGLDQDFGLVNAPALDDAFAWLIDSSSRTSTYPTRSRFICCINIDMTIDVTSNPSPTYNPGKQKGAPAARPTDDTMRTLRCSHH